MRTVLAILCLAIACLCLFTSGPLINHADTAFQARAGLYVAMLGIAYAVAGCAFAVAAASRQYTTKRPRSALRRDYIVARCRIPTPTRLAALRYALAQQRARRATVAAIVNAAHPNSR